MVVILTFETTVVTTSGLEHLASHIILLSNNHTAALGEKTKAWDVRVTELNRLSWLLTLKPRSLWPNLAFFIFFNTEPVIGCSVSLFS